MHSEDQQLLDSYVHGNSDAAFHAIVNRHSRWVFAAAYRQLRDRHLAEDATQAVFILLVQRSHSMPPDSKLPGWLFKTLHFTIRNIQRTRRRAQRLESRLAVTVPKTSEKETEKENEELVFAIDHAVARLPDGERQAILLRFYQDQTHAEIARALGITETAARKRVSRAMELLRQRVGSSLTETALGAAAIWGMDQSPAALVAGITSAATAAGSGAALPAGLAATVKGAASLMALSKIQSIAVWGAVFTIVVGLPFAVVASSLRTSSGGTSANRAPLAENFVAEPNVMQEQQNFNAADVPCVTLGPFKNSIGQIVFSPEALVVLDGQLRFYALPTATRQPTILMMLSASNDQSDQIASVAFAPRDVKAAVQASSITYGNGTRISELRFNGLAGGKSRVIPTGPVAPILLYSPDGRTVASAGSQNTGIKLWDAATGDERFTLEQAIASSMAFSLDSTTFAAEVVQSNGDVIKLWDVTSGKEVATLPGPNFHPAKAAMLVFSPDGRTLATSSHQEEVRLWDLPSRKVRASFAVERRAGVALEQFGAICFSPDGKTLAVAVQPTTGNPDREHFVIVFWDVSSGNRTKTIKGHKAYISALGFSSDGKVLVSGSDDKTVKVWYLQGPVPPKNAPDELPAPASPVESSPSPRIRPADQP